MDSSAEQKNTKHYPIHVTFDSNTVEYVLGVKPYDANTLGDYFDQQLSNSYAILKAAIDSGKIIPYISEGYFTSEAIEKKQRKVQLGKPPKIKTNVTESQSKPTTVQMTLCIAPAVHVKLNSYFKAVSNALGARGGKVLPGIRIAFPVCDEVKPLHVEFGNGKPTWEGYVKRYGQIHQYIENELDDGLKHLKQVLQKNILENPIPPEKDNSFYRNNIRNGATDLLFADNNLTPKKLAANVAELADCDMVCEHWAYCNDFICTCDISKGQGCSGILHPENIKRLNKKFTILVRSPNELAAEIE